MVQARTVEREEMDHDHVVKDFQGVNTQAGRTAIAESEFAWLENVMPVGFANLKCVPHQGVPVATLAGLTIQYWKYVNIGNVDYLITACSNGSMQAVNLATFAVTVIGAASTFTLPVAVSQWKNERVLIISAGGYFDWDGTTLTAQNGRVLAVNILVGGTSFTDATAAVLTPDSGAATFTVTLGVNLALLVAAGTNYITGDVLTIQGGTSTTACVLKVSSTGGGGAITGLQLFDAGVYTVAPANPAAVLGGHGTGATFTLNFGINAVTVTDPGSGYSVPPAITVTNGGAAFTGTIAGGTTLTVAAIVGTAQVVLGQAVYGAGVTPGTTVTAFGTGTGGNGDYTITASANVGPEAMTTGGVNTNLAVVLGTSATGQTIATFSGRVWIGDNRTIIFSAPGSYQDFSTASSGGSFIVTDETLHSNINAMVTANNFLYLFGDASINVLSDVRLGTGSPIPTLFSNTNVTALVGSNLPASVFIYNRSIAFATRYGFYVLVGATPEKISEKLDGIIPLIDFTKPVSGDVANIFGILCMCWSFTYKDPVAQARPLQALFFNKKWFFCSQGEALTLVTGAFQNGTPAIFGTDGANIWKLFSDPAHTIASMVQTALWPMKYPTRMKEANKSGLEITTVALITPTNIDITFDSDFGSISGNLVLSNFVQWINNANHVVQWVNNANQVVQWFANGFIIYQADSESKGRYLGYTLRSTAPAYAINGFLTQYQLSTNWATRAA